MSIHRHHAKQHPHVTLHEDGSGPQIWQDMSLMDAPPKGLKPVVRGKRKFVSSHVVCAFGLLVYFGFSSTLAAQPLQTDVSRERVAAKESDRDSMLRDRINLNAASVDELCELPGIGPKRAEQIIDHRKKRPFSRVSQLVQIKGIGWKTLKKIRPLVYIGPAREELRANPQKESPGAVSKPSKKEKARPVAPRRKMREKQQGISHDEMCTIEA